MINFTNSQRENLFFSLSVPLATGLSVFCPSVFRFSFVERSRDKFITSVRPPHTVSTLPRPRPVAVSRITRTVNLPTKLAFESRSRGVRGNFVFALLQNRTQITRTVAKRERKNKKKNRERSLASASLYVHRDASVVRIVSVISRSRGRIRYPVIAVASTKICAITII